MALRLNRNSSPVDFSCRAEQEGTAMDEEILSEGGKNEASIHSAVSGIGDNNLFRSFFLFLFLEPTFGDRFFIYRSRD